MEAALDHCELVVSASGVAAALDIASKQDRSFTKFPFCDSQIRQLQKSVGIIGIQAKRLLKHLLGGRLVPLTFLDVAEIERAGIVMRIQLQSFPKIFCRLVEAAKVTVRKPQEGVRSRRRIKGDQTLELCDGSVPLPCHEDAFSQRGMEIAAPRSEFQTGLEQRNRVFKVILAHADPSQ